MVKFTHISNYSNLMRFTIFKCGSGYTKDPNSRLTIGVFVLHRIQFIFDLNKTQSVSQTDLLTGLLSVDTINDK